MNQIRAYTSRLLCDTKKGSNLKYTTQYLYRCDPKDFMDLKYIEALNYKIDKAKEVMNTLREESRNIPWNDVEHDIRINHYLIVEKAKLFNEDLLEELKCC